jgi:DNA polymerase-3 subunit alpha
MDNTDKVVNFLGESRALGLEVLPPEINASNYMFEATDAKTIRYGLGAVKGVGRGAVENIVEARRAGAYTDLDEFCRRVDPTRLNKRVFEALIMSGSLDALANTRASLMAQLPEAMRAAEQQARDAQAGQNDMFGAASPATPRRVPADVPEWPIAQRLSGERDTLGHYLSGHPTDAWREVLVPVTTGAIGDLDRIYKPPAREGRQRFADLQAVTLAGSVVAVRKQGDNRAFVTVEDWSGKFEAVLYRETWIEYGPLLTRDAILVFEGGLSVDDFSGGYQVRVQHVSTIEAACEKRARLLRLRLNGVHGDFVARLHGALAGHRGGHTPVRVSYRNATGQAEIELGAEWRVRASPALKDTLQALDGVIAAELVFG